MDVSENSGTPKSSILMVFSINKPSILGFPLFLETPIWGQQFKKLCDHQLGNLLLQLDDMDKSWEGCAICVKGYNPSYWGMVG